MPKKNDDLLYAFNNNNLHIIIQKGLISKNVFHTKFVLEKLFKSTKKIQDINKINFEDFFNFYKKRIKGKYTLIAKTKYKTFIGNGQKDIYYQYQLICNNEKPYIDAINKNANNKINQSTILHPITLNPFIPGSSIQGAFRSYLVLKYFKEDSEIIHFLFGDIHQHKSIGIIRFYDAHPVQKQKESLINSIINGKIGEKTVPLNFIHINSNIAFQFQIDVRTFNLDNLKSLEDKNLKIISNELDHSYNSIRDGLYRLFQDFLEHGSIGARESVGWGEFTNIEEVQ